MNASPEPARAIFEQALELKTPEERRAFLERACPGQPELREEVESLLLAHEQAGDFLCPTVLTTPPEPPVEQAGTRIGRFKLLEQIGEGGFGAVWMAEQEEPVRRRVALKIIKLGMDTKEVVARFEAERQALAMMDHPSIATVFDGGATMTGRPYFVMELVKGVPLTTYCDAKTLSTRDRLELFLQVCHAVQHAHQKGIIHRDLKPSNILVTEQDGHPVPKVIDFGVAKATQSRLTGKTLFTRFNQWIGTPAYMSPEQAGLANHDVDTRSDVYSLGVLLYELLTGRTPFDTQKLLEAGYEAVMRTIREEEPPKPSTRISTLAKEELITVAAQRGAEPAKLDRMVRGDLDWIVMKTLEKDRKRRYESAVSLAVDVERHLRAEPVLAAPPGLVYRAGKCIRRNRLRLAIAALATVAVVLAVSGGKLAWDSRTERRDFAARGTNTVFSFTKSGDVKALGKLLNTRPLLVRQLDADGSTPLFYAAQSGNTNTLSLLLAHGAEVDATNRLGLTPLLIAAMKNCEAAVLALLEAGANPNTTSRSGTTPLLAVSMYGSTTAGQALLARGARVDALSLPIKVTALHAAAMLGQANFVKLLLDHGAQKDVKGANDLTPLHTAAIGLNLSNLFFGWDRVVTVLTTHAQADTSLNAGVEMVSNLVAQSKTDLPTNFPQATGEHRRVAALLLARNAEIEAMNDAGCTPLWLAAATTNLAVAEELIAHQANLNARNKSGSTPLGIAADRGNSGMITLLLQAGANKNQPDIAGYTPLHVAVENRHRQAVEALLAHGADPNRACPGGQSPLHTAAMCGDVDMMKLLLNAGAYLHAQCNRSGTPLCSAITSEQNAAVEFLLQHGANPNLSTPAGITALHYATLLGQPHLVELLLRNGASNNMVGPSGTPLHVAVAGREPSRLWLASASLQAPSGWKVYSPTLGSEADFLAVAKLLLANGANVDAREPAYQRTPLFIAVREGNVTAVEALLEAGADVGARDAVGTTLLHAVSETEAAADAVSNVVTRLLKAGASPNTRDHREATPLHAAAFGGRTDAAARLIAAGADVNAVGPSQATPLHLALRSGQHPLVELLLARGADPERRTADGATALHFALVMRSKELAALLLEHGAHVDARAPDGTTSLIYAARAKDLEIVRLLLAHHAKIEPANQQGFTAILAAADSGQVDIAQLLLQQGAKLEDRGPNQDVPLTLAAKAGRLEMVKFLLDRGASITTGNQNGFNALHGAADHGHAEVVEFLLDRGMDVNAQTTIGYTPLHCTANAYFTNETRYVAVARVLLAHQANANARTLQNHTPLHQAAAWGRAQIVELLLAAKADPDLRDDDGQTALDFAVRGQHDACVKLLRGDR